MKYAYLYIFYVLVLMLSCSWAQKMAKRIGYYDAKYSSNGTLLPRYDYTTGIDMQFGFYERCNVSINGYQSYVFETFLNGDCRWNPVQDAEGILPGLQDGKGIVSYLLYHDFTSNATKAVAALETAKMFGNYLVNEALTSANAEAWPNYPRSTGSFPAIYFPLTICGQGDLIYGRNTIEPDKGAMAAYALDLLHEVTGNETYHNVAVGVANTLVAQMRPWNLSTHIQSPWAFRVNADSGLQFTRKNSNTASALMLFDRLIERNKMSNLSKARDSLWEYILVQISAKDEPKENLWVGFFEDKIDLEEINRNSWAPLELAHYLLQRSEKYDPLWKEHVGTLLSFAIRHFSKQASGNVTLMTEQDNDLVAWGGACSKLIAVAALYECRGGPAYFKRMAQNLLAWMTYFVRSDGCANDRNEHYLKESTCGGWQEDAFFAKINNWIVGVNAMNGKCDVW